MGGNGGKWAVMGVSLEIDAAGSEKCREMAGNGDLDLYFTAEMKEK